MPKTSKTPRKTNLNTNKRYGICMNESKKTSIIMKRFLVFIVMLSLASCIKDEKKECVEVEPGVIEFYFSKSDNPFNGALSIFPCYINSDRYFGNFLNGALSPVNPSYVVTNGVISATAVPLRLPLGDYRFVYWGVDDTPLSGSYSLSSGVSLTSLLGEAFWSLRKISSSTYYFPALNQVFAADNVSIGQLVSIHVPLSRKVAGLNVIIKNADGTPFNSNIASFDAIVDGIALKVNMNTGDPDLTSTVSVKIPVAISADRVTASNLTAMLYPSVDASTLTIVATLGDGSEAKFAVTLANKFIANQEQTVTISIDKILGGGGLSGFTVNQWTSVSQDVGGVVLD